MSYFTPEDFDRAEREAREAHSRLSQAEQDRHYLGAMQFAMRSRRTIESQLTGIRAEIERAPGHVVPEPAWPFSAPDSVLALEYPCSIAWADHVFFNAEQILHYEKALLFVDRETAAAILAASDLAACRALSKGVKNFYSAALEDSWTGLLYNVNQAKFSQHNDAQAQLLATGGHTLLLLNPEDHFLSGHETDDFDPDDPDYYDWIIRDNILGEVLTYLRTSFSGKY